MGFPRKGCRRNRSCFLLRGRQLHLHCSRLKPTSHAFIGPGTITLCVLAGVQNGFSLLWAMLLSIFITIVIQNTTARISFTTRMGLAESLLLQTSNPIVKFLLGALLISAIFVGNAAYEAGNLTGALVGIQTLTPEIDFYFGTDFYFLPLLVGSLVAVLIVLGSHKLLKNILIGIVLLMSISFVLTAVLTQPNVMEVLRGMFIPSFNSKDTLTIVGLLGTTPVRDDRRVVSGPLQEARRPF